MDKENGLQLETSFMLTNKVTLGLMRRNIEERLSTLRFKPGPTLDNQLKETSGSQKTSLKHQFVLSKQ